MIGFNVVIVDVDFVDFVGVVFDVRVKVGVNVIILIGVNVGVGVLIRLGVVVMRFVFFGVIIEGNLVMIVGYVGVEVEEMIVGCGVLIGVFVE